MRKFIGGRIKILDYRITILERGQMIKVDCIVVSKNKTKMVQAYVHE